MTAKQLDRALDILERFATVAERWADVEYPKRDDSQEETYLSKVGATKEARSPEEYAALPDDIGRFESRFTSSKA